MIACGIIGLRIMIHRIKRLRVSSGIDPHLWGGGIAVVETSGISCIARFVSKSEFERPYFQLSYPTTPIMSKCQKFKVSPHNSNFTITAM